MDQWLDQMRQTPWVGNGLIFAGAALLAVWLMMRRRLKQALEPQLTPREKIERLKQEGAVRNDMSRMMVELEDLTRRFHAQLEARSIQLEKLIEEADRRLEDLRHAAAPSDSQEAPPAGEWNPSPRLDPLTDRICSMADAGKTAVEIASVLDEQVGKVELILALRRQQA